MPQKRKLGTPDSLSGLRSQVIQIALTMQLPTEDKEVDKCLHWSWSESRDRNERAALLFHRRSLLLLCPRGGVSMNALS